MQAYVSRETYACFFVKEDTLVQYQAFFVKKLVF